MSPLLVGRSRLHQGMACFFVNRLEKQISTHVKMLIQHGQNADTTWLEQKGSGCWTYAHGSGMGVEGYASGEDDSQGSGDLLGVHEFLMPLQVLSSLSSTFDFSTNMRVFMVLICVDSLFFCL